MAAKAKKVVKVNLKSKQMLPQYSDEDLTGLAERIGLTLELLKLLYRCAHATYQYIGADLANLEGNERGMSRECLVEVVLDANYMDQAAKHILTPELKKWKEKGYSQYTLDWVYEAVGAGFPFAMYE
jgi:hypothetical protein